MRRPILILLLLAIAAGPLIYYLVYRDHPKPAAQSASGSGPSAQMMGAMHRMHESAVKVPMTGDIDRDFVALMVPHHQSAVEMARVYLKHGKDPELRRLSENIVVSQEAEIRQMNGRGGTPAAGSPTGH